MHQLLAQQRTVANSGARSKEKGDHMKGRVMAIGVMVTVALLLAGCARPGPTETLVEYSRSGGIAGFDDHLVIRADGQATLTRRGQSSEFALDRDTLVRLQALLDDAQFTRLDGEYLPSSSGADLFTYVIAYRDHTVRTMDTAVPEALQPALELLNQIVADHGKP